MNFTTSTTNAAGLVLALLVGLLCAFGVSQASAEAVRTVNGDTIDSSVLEFYIRSRTNQPPEQVSAEQRNSLLAELTDIYLLTTQETADDLRDDPQVAAQIELQSRGVLAQAVASQFFADTEVSEEEIQAEYEAQSQVAPPQQYKARHILVETQGKAADLISQLDAGGDFEALARTESTGPSGESGGDLGWFSPDQMVEPFSNAVAGLEDGAYTKTPVQTDFGWHVILREGSREAEPPPLDSVRDQITQAVQQRKFQAHLEDLRESGTIEN